MSPITVPMGVLRAGARQAMADLRPQFVGAGLFSLVVPVAIIIATARMQTDASEGSALSFGAILAAGAVGSSSALVIMQLCNESFQDRSGGALLRVRILPHGPMAWAVGKTISCVGAVVTMQVAMLLAASLVIEGVSLNLGEAARTLGIIVLSSCAVAPLGFLAGAVARGAYSQMLVMAGVMAVLLTSGFLLPMSRMPQWLQAVQYALPFYWSGHLSRWLLVGVPAWEPMGHFQPVLAAGVLMAWVVLGFAAVPFIVRRSFRKETISGLSRMQSKLRGQMGL